MKRKIIISISLLILSIAIHAQTGGPGQPEFMKFKPVTATDLVNPSNGSFSYNIPLFEIGGYPCNLSYQSGIQTEEVASDVGLGWNINIGAITINVRGLSDYYKGDIVTRNIYMRPNITFGRNYNLGLEIGGIPANKSKGANLLGGGLNVGKGIFFNSYNGWGIERNYGVNFSISNSSKTNKAGIGLGMKANSQNGIDVYAQPNVSMTQDKSSGISATGSLGGVISINSREGIKGSINVSMDFNLIEKFNIRQQDPAVKKVDKMEETFANFSAAYSFSKTPEIPRVIYPFKTKSYAGSLKVGGEISFFYPNGTISGYYTKQDLSTNTIKTSAYGFLYSDQAVGDNVLHDFNREKDQPYIKDVSLNIGIPFYTNDIYSVDAQGISGSFQLSRNDIGVIFDNKVMTSSTAFNLGLEAGIGNAFHTGADISSTSSSSYTGKWDTDVTANLDFKKEEINDLYQPAFFRSASDVYVDQNKFFDLLKKDQAIKVQLEDVGYTQVKMVKELIGSGANLSFNNTLFKSIRDPRTINIQYLTADLAQNFALEEKIISYKVNTFNCSVQDYKTFIPRVSGYRQGYHPSQITATNFDGMVYVFGLPVYNKLQKEVAFTLDASQRPGNDGLVTYNPGMVKGENGKDGFYESTELPPYVTSHLLTAVLSPDYIDVDDNGPSINDVGNYAKFNYTFAGPYNWRTPYDNQKATFNQAFLSDQTDNKASYVYGIKELWYIHSVESKMEIAEFHYDTTTRQDGLGVLGEEGGKNTSQKLYKLEEIRIYSINDKAINGSNAVPIRIIKFKYDYELCPGIKNTTASNGGKLTLKEVAFCSGKSKRELQSPYKFTYGKMTDSPNIVINPSYNPRYINRWGNYQVNDFTSDININTSIPISNIGLSNIDFPYSSQNDQEMKQNAYAWNLTHIKLPSGGTIQAIYEPHRYAYTQDRRNMEMLLIEGVGIDSVNIIDSILYNNSNLNFLKFKLRTPITGNDPYKELLYKYFNINLQGTGVLTDLPGFFYYKSLVKLRSDNIKSWEWISGYLKIKNVGFIPNTNYAYIEVEPVCINDKKESNFNDFVNPIAKSAWQFMRMYLPELCYGNANYFDPNSPSLKDFLDRSDLEQQVNEQTQAFFQGFNKWASEKKHASEIALNKSFIRLYSPDLNKIIGGSRVKTIITNDNWFQSTSTASVDKSYSIDYEYTDVVKNPVTGQDQVISSGVMEFEPPNGGDENPLRQPDFYNQHIKMAPDNNLYVVSPYNEFLFPAQNLIYSKVKVASNKTQLDVPGTGYQEYEFVTAKDYPVQTDRTTLGDNHQKMTSFLEGLTMSILGMGEFHDYVTLSQGFSITNNDMHGKQLSVKNFNSQGSLVSSEESEYVLNNDLQLIGQDGKVYTSDKLGVSVSAICDARTTEHTTEVNGVDLNLDFTIYAVIPAVLFMPLPKATTETTRLNTVAFNKIIYKKGIPIRKTVTENGARVSTENLLFDDHTGNVILTRTTTEFRDSIYSFTYPAHWIYEGLSAGYRSSDFKFNMSISGNTFNYSTLSDVLKEGDEIFNTANQTNKYWITAKNGNTFTLNSKIMADPVSLSGTWQVLRPGRRNMLTQEAGTVVSLKNPIVNGKLNVSSQSNVLNAGMNEYSDLRIKLCCDDPKMFIKGEFTSNPAFIAQYAFDNPFSTGERGNWYPNKSWAFITDRVRSFDMTPPQTNIRKDGFFVNYNNFWNPPSGNNKWTNTPLGWQWTEMVTIKDVHGLTLEGKNVLNIYNSVLTGYKNSLVVAAANNAMQREIFYDGFEDWNYFPIANNCDPTYICEPDPILRDGIFNLSNTESHTGKYSGKLIQQQKTISVPLLTNYDCPPRKDDTSYYPDDSICCVGKFKPIRGKEYTISAWVRDATDPLAYHFADPSIEISGISFHASGNVIDGWQRIYGEFTIPLNSTSLEITIKKVNPDTYFDDIRIFPADGKMVTYVYDGNTQKLTFTCDENNYFTKYNYDGSNNLGSISVETPKGVQTINESRSSTQINH